MYASYLIIISDVVTQHLPCRLVRLSCRVHTSARWRDSCSPGRYHATPSWPLYFANKQAVDSSQFSAETNKLYVDCWIHIYLITLMKTQLSKRLRLQNSTAGAIRLFADNIVSGVNLFPFLGPLVFAIGSKGSLWMSLQLSNISYKKDF